MSYDLGWAALNLQPTDRIPRTEYISHRGLIQKLTGIDKDHPEPGEDWWWAISKALDFGFVWNTFSIPNTDRLTHMGTAIWSEEYEVVDNRTSHFTDIESVLAFEPEKAFDVPTVDELAEQHQRDWLAGQEKYSHCVFPGGYYNTIVSWCIGTFGWDFFLTAVALEPACFSRVLDGFEALSMLTYEAQARTDMKVFICHDDIVWSQGAVFHPDWYRREVFPRYKRLFRPLLEAGKKIIFCSDGDFTEFVDDLAALGVHGFIFEPMTSLDYIVERYGKTHAIIGNADCRVLMSGPAEAIEQEVLRCVNLGKPCPGYFIAVGNHIPYNIPLENVELYLELSEKHGRR